MDDLLRIIHKYEGSRTAVYGLSIETEKTLAMIDSRLNVVGLLDGYRESGMLYGKRIISLSEAIKCEVELILVVARPGSCRAIAGRIRASCMENGIALIDVRGKNLCDEYRVSYDLKKIPGITKEHVMNLIDRNDVISIDLFDTLIMRNTLFGTDILEMAKLRLEEMGIVFADFPRKRLDSEKFLSRTGAPTLEEIYSYMISEYGLRGISAHELSRLEWEADYGTVVPRKELCSLIAQAYGRGKEVYIVSDTYYTRDELEKMLEKCGIDFYTDIYASCEHHTGKAQALYKKLGSRLRGRSCVHIGDDAFADVECARRDGLEACLVYSGIDLFEASGYLGMKDDISSLSDRIKAGMFVAGMFNSPFQFEASDRKISVRSSHDIGYLLFAPMITDFVIWFREQVLMYNLKNVLFCARDGYLIKRMYDRLCGDYSSVYLLTSRTAAIRAGVGDREDVSFVEQMKFAGSVADQLEERFGIVLDCKERGVAEEKNLADYAEIILRAASAYRKNYQTYIDRLKLFDGDAAFFDFVAKGTSQMFMGRLIRNHLKGLYFLRMEKENMADKGLDIVSFYDDEPAEGSAVFQNYYIMETVLTSKMPSVMEFDAQGEAVYDGEARSREDIECAMNIQEGICDYFDTYLALCPENERHINKALDEKLLMLVHGLDIKDRSFIKMKVEDRFFNRYTDMEDLI